jgi:hypothetical protein
MPQEDSTVVSLYRSVESSREGLLLDDVQQLDFEHQRGARLDDRR